MPKLAEIFGVSIEELINAKSAAAPAKHNKVEHMIDLILKAIPTAMGVAVVVTLLLGELDVRSGFSMLGIGLACLGIYLLKRGD